ncbi:MAG: YlbF family regulator [Syntrophomonadaceae bacterium]|nr:YlbF family regulator [Syntrophomonadaceae bacterium]
MNVYDKAYETARALKETPHYKAYIKAREELKADQSSWEMVKDFRSRQTNIQKQILSGEEPTAEKINELQELSEIIGKSQRATEFFRAEMDLIKVVEDIQRILVRSIDLEMENI